MTPLAATAAERLAFETEMLRLQYFEAHELVQDQYSYIDEFAVAAWLAWQAARALQQTAEPVCVGYLDVKSEVFFRPSEWAATPRNQKLMASGEVVRVYAAAPDRAPSTDSAADARDAALWRNLIDDTNAQPCAYKCLRDDLGDWIRERAGVQTVGKDAERLDFIQSNPEIRLIYRKNRWGFVGFTNYEYEVFKTVREAIDAAIAASLPQTKEE